MWVSPPPGVGPLLFHGDGTSFVILRPVWRSASTPLAYEVGWRLAVTPPPFGGGWYVLNVFNVLIVSRARRRYHSRPGAVTQS